MVHGECHDIDSGTEFFGDDLAFYRNSSIYYTTNYIVKCKYTYNATMQ